jgi:hypothetical protein
VTFWAFAADHPLLALLFSGLAFSLPVTLAALFVSWRVSRPVRYSAEDRKALTSATTFVRLLCATNKLNEAEALEHAGRLERMAGR